MPKVITSPSKTWPGSVTIADPMTLPQVEALEESFDISIGTQERVRFTVLDKPRLPAILACVEKWELENFPESPTAENFPMTPRPRSHELLQWLFDEIMKVYLGEIDIPNASSPTLTDTQAKDATPRKSKSSAVLTASD